MESCFNRYANFVKLVKIDAARVLKTKYTLTHSRDSHILFASSNVLAVAGIARTAGRFRNNLYII